MYTIVKIDNNMNTKFLSKTYRNEYMFSGCCPNIYFKTEDGAYNFIFNNYQHLKPLMKNDDYLMVEYYHKTEGDES